MRLQGEAASAGEGARRHEGVPLWLQRGTQGERNQARPSGRRAMDEHRARWGGATLGANGRPVASDVARANVDEERSKGDLTNEQAQ